MHCMRYLLLLSQEVCRSKGPYDVFDPWVHWERVRLGSESSSGASGISKSGDLEIWEFGDLGTWKSRNLGSKKAKK